MTETATKKKANAFAPAQRGLAKKCRAIKAKLKADIGRIVAEGQAREEVRRVAAGWLLAVRHRIAVLRQEVSAFRSAAGKEGSLLSGIFHDLNLQHLCRDLESADTEAMGMTVMVDLPVPNPQAFADSLTRKYPALAAAEPNT